MALDQSALLEVLEVLKAAEVDDKFRQAAETIYQALIEAELSPVIGAVPARADQFAGGAPERAATRAVRRDLRFPASATPSGQNVHEAGPTILVASSRRGRCVPLLARVRCAW